MPILRASLALSRSFDYSIRRNRLENMMSLDPHIRDRILAAVDEAFDAQIAFTQDLVRHPSLRTREGGAQQLLFEAMEQRGLEMDRWELDPEELSAHPGA